MTGHEHSRANPLRWRALCVSLLLHLLGLGVMAAEAVRWTPEPQQPVWAKVELVQQDTPAVGEAAGSAIRTTPAPSVGAALSSLPRSKDGALVATRPSPQVAPTASPLQQNSGTAPAPVVATHDPPVIRLGEGDELGTGVVSGSAVIPAGVDATVHNRLPVYPEEAARLGEEGEVVLLVHIAPDGSAGAVDVEQSSGYEILDRRAREAVSQWRFRPAVQDGLPIASVMEVDLYFDIRRTRR